MTIKHYRILVLSSLLFAALSVVIDVLFPSELIRSYREYGYSLDALSGFQSLIYKVFAVLTSVLLVASVAGLLLFKPWARLIYLLSYLCIFPIYLITGVYIVSGVAQIMYDISMVLAGLILGLVYYSPLKTAFKSG